MHPHARDTVYSSKGGLDLRGTLPIFGHRTSQHKRPFVGIYQC